MADQIKVIDLFSGPGGLGEGFSSFGLSTEGSSPFKIAISIEKEESAHSTLTLRSFYRQFPYGEAPTEYYDFLKGKLGKTPEEKLYLDKKFSTQVAAAKYEARCLTLGEQNTEIYKAIDNAIMGDPCIVIGGPPCQAYSLVGRARRSSELGYVAKNDNRNFLYQEYLKILARYTPLAFVMENVKGMLSAEVDGNRIFDQILMDLHDPCKFIGKKGEKYRVFSMVTPPSEDHQPSDYIIRAENYGIPQARHRVILLGIQEKYADLLTEKMLLKQRPGPELLSIIGGLPKLRSGLSKEMDSHKAWTEAISLLRQNTIKEISKAKSLGVDADRLCKNIEAAINSLGKTPDYRGSNFSLLSHSAADTYENMSRSLAKWYKDPSGRVLVCNHETRGHIRDDLKRYLFASAWAKTAKTNEKPFPKAEDYPSSLRPQHKNFNTGVFSDRFRVQVKDRYATTVTSHISKDGHYFIHYDPSQCRSLTVREAARIQTFPDNYFFVGNRTQQYVQVGNAVPPLLANQIAELVNKVLIAAGKI